MEVFRGQEASLESSKDFYRGNKPSLTDVSTHAPKSMRIYTNFEKYMEVNEMHENPRKSEKYDGTCQRTRSQPGIEQSFL